MSQNRVNKILIGGNIARTAALVLYGAGCNLAEGEVVVLDKNKELLAAGATIADTDTIYIAVGTGETYDYVTETGVSVAGVRKLKISTPIEGALVKSFKGLSYSAATQRVASVGIDTSATFAPVIGDEYVVRIVYRDITEHPGQFVQEYRHIATTVTPADLTNALLAKVNRDNGARVAATNVADDLVLTGKVIPYNTIDDYSQVDFEVTFYKGDHTEISDVAVTYSANATSGNGNPRIVRDREKHALGYEGVLNTTHFPVVAPEFVSSLTATYDSIIIESDKSYLSADNQYMKEFATTTELYIPVDAGQTADVLAVLNPWMASLPGSFDAVNV